MDAAVAAAITAIPFEDAGQAQQWFRIVCQAHDHCEEGFDWHRFAAELAELAEAQGPGRQVAEQFTGFLSDNDPAPAETVRRMRELGEDLPRVHEELVRGAAGHYDEAAWHGFLVENGPRWDGDEATWGTFRQWFVHEAARHGVAVPAEQFAGYADSQPDKVAVFAEYGVVITPVATGSEQAAAPEVESYPELEEGASGEWVEYLDAMLASRGY